MEEKQIRTVELENHLRLNFYDHSKKIAGDRWFVSVTAKVDIQVADALSAPDDLPNVSADEIREKIGETVAFEKKLERNFVSEGEKDEVFENLLTSFLSNTRSYLSLPEFSRRFVLRAYQTSLNQPS